ncbi:DUF6779 domain-containing protein [Amycolatopsis sp. NPDC004368]
MTGVGDDSRGRLLGRPWLVVGFVLALGATLALVLSDDLKLLRLGIVAALWAALIGAFLAVRYRKHAAHSEDAVAEAQAVYELELEREIAARREYELEIEAETREAAEAQSREELDALRAEVSALRESLQSLFGGEVLLERVALTAQATRMRSLNDDQRLMSAGSESKNGNGKKPAQLMAPKKPVVGVGNDRPTELMDRVLDAPSAGSSSNGSSSNGADRRRKPATPHGPGQGQGPNGKPPAALNTQRTQQLARPKQNRPKPAPEPESAAARAVKAAELRAEAARRQAAESQPTRTVAPVSPPAVSAAEALESTRQVPRTDVPRPDAPRAEVSLPSLRRVEPPVSGAEVSHPGVRPASRAEASQPSMRRVEPPVSRAEASRPDLPRVERPVGESTAAWKPAWDASADFGDRGHPSGDTPPKPREATASRTDLPPVAPVAKTPEPPRAEPAQRKPSRLEQFSRADLSPLADSPASTRHGAHSSSDDVEEPVNPTLPESVRTTKSTGGRRRRSDDDAADTPAGGRRRRPDGEPPAWEGMVTERASQSRRTPDPDPAGGHRSAEADPAGGSHAAGRSVTELLAANGAEKSAPRRRRRAED